MSPDTNPPPMNSVSPDLRIPPHHCSFTPVSLTRFVALIMFFLSNKLSANGVASGTPPVVQPCSALRAFRRNTSAGSQFEVAFLFASLDSMLSLLERVSSFSAAPCASKARVEA